ncbi:imidazolonepropionase [Paenibacillus sp. V4I9]|nr:imidazolonepropionase [Paenibacillus sp. V4I9]
MDNNRIDLLIHNIGTLITMQGTLEARRGGEMSEVAAARMGAVAIRDGIIVAAGSEEEVLAQIGEMPVTHKHDAEGRLVTPGLIDPHTHLVHGGSRENELALKLQGASYLEILAQGGGILSTVRSTRQASEEELYVKAKKKLGYDAFLWGYHSRS